MEAQEHYPTDVLMGAALGNFIAILVHDAFLGTNNNMHVFFDSDGRMMLTFVMHF